MATVYGYRWVPETLRMTLAASRSLQDWLHPDLPEDLCLLRQDGEPWLVSVTHEGDFYLRMTDGEWRRFSRLAPTLQSMLGPPSEVPMA